LLTEQEAFLVVMDNGGVQVVKGHSPGPDTALLSFAVATVGVEAE